MTDTIESLRAEWYAHLKACKDESRTPFVERMFATLEATTREMEEMKNLIAVGTMIDMIEERNDLKKALETIYIACLPLLDNAEGYDKSNVRHAFLHTTDTGAWTREQLLTFEENARNTWKSIPAVIAKVVIESTPKGKP